MLAVGGNVVVVVNGRPGHIGIAKLLSFINKGSATQCQKNRCHDFRRLFRIRSFREEVVHTAGLVVIFKKDRTPTVRRRHFLAGSQGAFQFRKFPLGRTAPDFPVFEMKVYVAEFKHHVKHALRAYPFGQIFRRDAVRFAYGKNIPARKHFPLELMKKIQNPRRIGRHCMNRGQTVLPVRRTVPEFRFLYVGDRVNAETAHAFVQPEAGRIVKGFSHFRVFPVKVRLLRRKGVKIILLAFLTPSPGRAAENAAPVGRRAAIRFGVPPDIPVRLRIHAVFPGFLKPAVLVGTVVKNEVHNNADVAFSRFFNKGIEILHGPVGRVDAFVV